MNVINMVWSKFGFCVFVGIFMVSCVTHKKVPYFKDLADASAQLKSIPTAVYAEPVIQIDDILSISIQTIDPQTSLVTNQVAGSMPSIGTSSNNSIGQQTISGFLVDKEGNVEISVVGKIKLEGLTITQARTAIRDKALKYYKDPSVTIRVANFRVTVLGEVAKPGTYTLAYEKVNILEVLGLVGDLTIYGKRENVMLIRDNKGKKEYVRLNLNDSQLFSSEYFFLKQNDVIYVEPNKAKIASNNTARIQAITLATAAISLLIVIFTRVNFLK